MKIYTAINAIPPRESMAGSKFLPVWKALALVSERNYMPVECSTVGEAGHLKQECTRRGLTAERRKKTVFIQGVAIQPMALPQMQAVDPAFADTPFPNIRRIAEGEAASGTEELLQAVSANA